MAADIKIVDITLIILAGVVKMFMQFWGKFLQNIIRQIAKDASIPATSAHRAAGSV